MRTNAKIRDIWNSVAGAPPGKLAYKGPTTDPLNTVWTPLFTITGLVLVRLLIGIRTTVQAAGAANIQFRWQNAGVTVLDILDAGTLSIAADIVGVLYYVTFDPIDPVQSGSVLHNAIRPVTTGKVVATATKHEGQGLLAPAGTIAVTTTGAATTGACRYILGYVPIDPGSVVVPA